MKRIILDCDLGTDDAIALYLLLVAEMQKRAKIEMIVCTSGNSSLENVSKNVVRVLEVAKRTDIPVYQGAYDSILPKPENTGFYHGVDGFGDLEYDSEPDTSIIRPEPAFVAMRELILSNPNEITLVCIGPLTNAAILLRMYGDVAEKIKDIHIMGGNHLGIGNTTSAAEFNFHSDPEAAHIIFACAKCPIYLLTWECCYVTKTPMKWRMDVLGTPSGGPAWQLITRAERSVYSNKEENWYTCDAYLIAALLYPEMIMKQSHRHVDVELAGRLTRGQVSINHARTKPPNAFVIEEIDYKFFEQLVLAEHTKL